MSADDIDALRSELLRQKIIFEAELRRQRESFGERLATIAQELADREADCRNLQSVITILGRKVDGITELQQHQHVQPATNATAAAPLRPPTPSRHASVHESPFRRTPSGVGSRGPVSQERKRTGSITSKTPTRRASPLISATSARRTNSALSRLPSNHAISRTESPHVVSRHNARPLLRTNTTASVTSETGSATGSQPRARNASRKRTTSTHRLTGVKATSNW